MKKVLFALTFIAATSLVAVAHEGDDKSKKSCTTKEAAATSCASKEGKKSCCASKESDKKADAKTTKATEKKAAAPKN